MFCSLTKNTWIKLYVNLEVYYSYFKNALTEIWKYLFNKDKMFMWIFFNFREKKMISLSTNF